MPTFHRPDRVVVITGVPLRRAGVTAGFVAAAAVVVGLVVATGWVVWVFFLLEGLTGAGLVTFIVVANRPVSRVAQPPAPPVEARRSVVLPAPQRRALPAPAGQPLTSGPQRGSQMVTGRVTAKA